MNNLKQFFKDQFPKLKNIVFIEIANPEFPNTLIFVSDILKIWVHVSDFDNPPIQEIQDHILLFRELGFITGYVEGDQFRMDLNKKTFDLEYVIAGNIVKWLGDDKPVNNPKLDFDFKEIKL